MSPHGPQYITTGAPSDRELPRGRPQRRVGPRNQGRRERVHRGGRGPAGGRGEEPRGL
ncbi:hypothetical protein LV35_04180 [Acinetobacter baumannii]|uniref:Uncharacterized protein n=1 Tax=Acinetobacter baumannii TaxID=470 RepID=A0AAJ0QTJ9_ACIBA|nr:hypothetical protein LV35_04180 [Acinetobacter baumannii]